MSSNIVITKRDIIWGYFGTFFNIGSGLITLPAILHFLTSEEIGMNYLMLTISTMVSMLDFGFAGQFGINFTFVNSGAQSLKKEGVATQENGEVNYHLLAVLIKTAKMVYRRISLLCILLMLTGGTYYIYYVTNGFSNVEHSLAIWLLFTLSVYFNVYFTYYNSLMRGSGKVGQLVRGEVLSRITYIVLCISMLFCGCGLFSVIAANFIAPFVLRAYCYKCYFTTELKSKLQGVVSKEETREAFSTLWYNAKKQGVNMIGGFLISKSSMFLIGFYLPLAVVGSYGLLVQLVSILSSVAASFFNTNSPKFANFRVTGDMDGFRKLIALSMLIFQLTMVLGCLVIIFLGNDILTLIHAKTLLPSTAVTALFCLAMLLEGNHSYFAVIISSGNRVPFVKPSLISGAFIILLTFLFLQFTDMQLLGIVLAPLVIQAIYNNWRWPKWVLDEASMTVTDFYRIGTSELILKANNLKRSICK